jgi:hypothetical protein
METGPPLPLPPMPRVPPIPCEGIEVFLASLEDLLGREKPHAASRAIHRAIWKPWPDSGPGSGPTTSG